jgi:drug/metabolite transporter (DMT)-like permease
VTHGLLAWAELRIPSGLAALLGSTIPLWVVLLEWFGAGDARPGARLVQGVAVGFVGVAVLVGPSITSADTGDLVASAAVLLGSLSWSLGTMRTRSAMLPKSRALSSGMQLLAGGALLVVASAATGELAELAGLDRPRGRRNYVVPSGVGKAPAPFAFCNTQRH